MCEGLSNLVDLRGLNDVGLMAFAEVAAELTATETESVAEEEEHVEEEDEAGLAAFNDSDDDSWDGDTRDADTRDADTRDADTTATDWVEGLPAVATDPGCGDAKTEQGQLQDCVRWCVTNEVTGATAIQSAMKASSKGGVLLVRPPPCLPPPLPPSCAVWVRACVRARVLARTTYGIEHAAHERALGHTACACVCACACARACVRACLFILECVCLLIRPIRCTRYNIDASSGQTK